jgi:hypothetical protein
MPAGTKVPARVFSSARDKFYINSWESGKSVNPYALTVSFIWDREDLERIFL